MLELTQSIEDYLEAIWIINLKKKVIRMKDLMQYFNHKVSTVNYAINILKNKQLVYHEKYGYVELTEKGAQLAQELYAKHKNLTLFLTTILMVDEKTASRDACSIEHHLDKKSYNHILKFKAFMKNTDIGRQCLGSFKKYLKKAETNVKEEKAMTLAELKNDQQAIIKKITAPSRIKNRLLSMGILPHEVIKIEKVAPMGDPVDVFIKGYHLSLRKEEAEYIIVEVLPS